MISKPSSTVIRPSATARSTLLPSRARSASSSSAEDDTRTAWALRISHVTVVPGSCRASSASARRVLAAEWPAPTTVVWRPANVARSRPRTSGSAGVTASVISVMPSSSRPLDESELGER